MEEISRTKKVFVLSLGQTLTTIAGIISGMVAARLLTKHDYATLRQTMLAYNFAAPILMLGLPNALYYFLPREHERKKGVVIDIFSLLLFLAILFSTFLLFGGHKFLAMRFENPDLNTTLKWMIGYPLYVMPASVLGAILLTENKTFALATFNVISSITLTGLTIIGTILTRDYTGPLFVQIYFPLLVLPFVIWLSFKYLPGKFTKPNIRSMRDMVKYAAPIGIASMLGMIMLETNKVIVAVMCTSEQFAEYVNGAIEIPLIGIITMAMSSIILVDMTKYVNNGDLELALNLFKTGAIKSASILMPVMIFLLINNENFIVTLYSTKYLESVVPFTIYLFILPVRIVMYSSALLAIGQSKIILVRSVFDLLINIILSVVFIYFFGYLGAAFATLTTLYIWTVPFNLYKIGIGFNTKSFNVLPFKSIGKIILLSCLALPTVLLVNMFVIPEYYFCRLLLSSVLFFPTCGVLLMREGYLQINDQMMRKIPSLVRNIIYKIQKHD